MIHTRQDQIDAREAMLARATAVAAEREQAVKDLAQVLGYALAVQPPGTAEDRMLWQFRRALISLGVSPAELNAAGIRRPR